MIDDDGPDTDDYDINGVIEQATPTAHHIIQLAADNQPNQVADVLEQFGETWGGFGIYAVCCAVAEHIRTLAYPNVPRGDGSLNGPIVGLLPVQGLESQPNYLWAGRFMVAYMNGDAENCSALFADQLDNNPSLGGVAQLIGTAGHLTRQRNG